MKEVNVRYLVEQESAAGCSSEACGDELSSVGQNGVTVGTGEQASPTNVIQEDASHFVVDHQVRMTCSKGSSPVRWCNLCIQLQAQQSKKNTENSVFYYW